MYKEISSIRKFTKLALMLLLAIAVALAFTPLTAYAAADGSSRQNAIDLTTTTEKSGSNSTSGEYWYKFRITAASKVIITIKAEFATPSAEYSKIILQHNNIDKGDIWGISLNSAGISEYLVPLEVNHEKTSQTTSYYLDANKTGQYYYIKTENGLNSGSKVTTTVKVAGTLSDTKSLDKSNPKSVNPAGGAVSQHSFSMEDKLDKAVYWYKFSVSKAAKVTIKQTRTNVIKNEGNISRLLLWNKNDKVVKGKSDGKSEDTLYLEDAGATTLTKSITYTLPKGTYHVQLDLGPSMEGVGHKLAFSTQYQLATPTKLKLTSKKATWKKVANNSGYTLKIYKGKKNIKTIKIGKNKTSYKIPKKIMKKSGKYKFTLVAKGKGNYCDSKIATSKVLKK